MFSMASEKEGPRTRQRAGPRSLIGQKAKTDPRKYSFAVRVVDPWNALPDSVREAKTQDEFKRKLKALRKKQS